MAISIPNKARELALACLGAEPVAALEALFAASSQVLFRDVVFSITATGILNVDLRHSPLTEPSAILVFASAMLHWQTPVAIAVLATARVCERA